jgi:tetratricopeptide (TPR) repeat protein
MEQPAADTNDLNPKAVLITIVILLMIPVIYVLFIKKDVEAPTPQVTQTTATTTESNAPTITANNKIEELKKAVAASPTESNYVNLGMAYYFNKQYHESIDASRKAIAINPNNALAYNNICSAYNCLSMWDSAIIAGQAALKIQPDFQLAKNNVAWAVSMKNKGQ